MGVRRGAVRRISPPRGIFRAVSLLVSAPGIGRVLANRLHEELGLETLADVEAGLMMADWRPSRDSAPSASLEFETLWLIDWVVSTCRWSGPERIARGTLVNGRPVRGQRVRRAPQTVITARYGPLRGQRVVAGREDECRALSARDPARSKPNAESRRRAAAHDLLSTPNDASRSLGG